MNKKIKPIGWGGIMEVEAINGVGGTRLYQARIPNIGYLGKMHGRLHNVVDEALEAIREAAANRDPVVKAAIEMLTSDIAVLEEKRLDLLDEIMEIDETKEKTQSKIERLREKKPGIHEAELLEDEKYIRDSLQFFSPDHRFYRHPAGHLVVQKVAFRLGKDRDRDGDPDAVNMVAYGEPPVNHGGITEDEHKSITRAHDPEDIDVINEPSEPEIETCDPDYRRE